MILAANQRPYFSDPRQVRRVEASDDAAADDDGVGGHRAAGVEERLIPVPQLSAVGGLLPDRGEIWQDGQYQVPRPAARIFSAAVRSNASSPYCVASE